MRSFREASRRCNGLRSRFDQLPLGADPLLPIPDCKPAVEPGILEPFAAQRAAWTPDIRLHPDRARCKMNFRLTYERCVPIEHDRLRHMLDNGTRFQHERLFHGSAA
ncbi:hypothetical protein D3C84_1025480 [compost metagenome]